LQKMTRIFFSDDGGFKPVTGQFPSVGRLELGAIGHFTKATSTPSQW